MISLIMALLIRKGKLDYVSFGFVGFIDIVIWIVFIYLMVKP